MTSPFKLIVISPLILCAVALAAALWAGPAAASWIVLIHESEDQNLCFNDPYQNISNGTQLVVTPHCYNNDSASLMDLFYEQGHLKGIGIGGGKCVDNRYQVQQDNNPIVIWDCNGGEAQQWDWDGASFHYHANPAFCASVAWNSANPSVDGGKLVLYHCNGQGNQKFVITTVPEGGGLNDSVGNLGRGGCVPKETAPDAPLEYDCD